MGEDEAPNQGSTFRREEARMLSLLYRAMPTGNEWRDEALCPTLCELGEADPEDWFAPDGTETAKQATDDCFQCPVRKRCLQWACQSKQKDGIWGGQPRSIRIQIKSPSREITPHDYDALVELPNPYTTDDTGNKFHPDNLTTWTGDQDEQER